MKKFISSLLGIIFVILVVIGVIICTYIFNQPSREGESRELIYGTWSDENMNTTFKFSDEGEFLMTKTDTGATIAKGYFKVDEENDRIKLLILPKDRDESVDIGLNLYFFSKLSYKDLTPSGDNPEENPATCKFLFTDVDDVYICERTDMEGSFYDGTSR